MSDQQSAKSIDINLVTRFYRYSSLTIRSENAAPKLALTFAALLLDVARSDVTIR
jgi:hypothetical protein